MEEILQTILVCLLYLLYILLFPVVMVVATPVILLWPGKRAPDGTRERRDIRGRYHKILKVWKSIGTGLPTPD